MKEPEWTYRETELLKREYPVKTARQIAEQLGRTERAVYIRAKRLGLKKGHFGTEWTPQMLTMLRVMFPITFNYALASYLGVSKRTMLRKAREMGLEKKPGFIEERKADIAQLIREGQKRSVKTRPSFPKGVHINPEHEFKKGHVESPETKAKRSAALKESWRIRKQRAQFRKDYNINNSI